MNERLKYIFLHLILTFIFIVTCFVINNFFDDIEGFWRHLFYYIVICPFFIAAIILTILEANKLFVVFQMSNAEFKLSKYYANNIFYKVIYVHPITEDRRTVRRGFSLPVFLFGGFVPLYRKQYSLALKYFAIIWVFMTVGSIIPIIGTLIVRQFSCFQLARRYPALYEKWLKQQGYIPVDLVYIGEEINNLQR